MLFFSDREGFKSRSRMKFFYFFFPAKPHVSLYMLACGFDDFGIYSRNAGQNHKGGASGQTLAH